MEGIERHHRSSIIFDRDPSNTHSIGPYTAVHSVRFWVDGITYQLRYLHHHPWKNLNIPECVELLFLRWGYGVEWRPFIHIPYEDEAFRWAARACYTRFLTSAYYDDERSEAFERLPKVFVVLVNGEPQAIDMAAISEPDSMTMAGPVWCPVANMTEERRHGPGGREIKRGSKHFAAGAKLYCFPAQWGDDYDQIEAVGRHRATHRYVKMIISSSWLENWRVQLVYSPAVVRMLWPDWDGSEHSKTAAQSYIDMMKNRLAQKRVQAGIPVWDTSSPGESDKE